MKHSEINSKRSCTSKFALITILGCLLPLSATNAEPLYSKGDWLFGVNAVKVLTNENLDSISAGGAPISGAGIDITDDTTLSFDVSYFLNSSIAFNFFGGLPASASLAGSGSLGGLPVGETKYGPAGECQQIVLVCLRSARNDQYDLSHPTGEALCNKPPPSSWMPC